MSFLAPGFLFAAGIAALGVVALHFIVTRRPRSIVFPTARFVPDVPSVARAKSLQFSDLLLLAVRVLTILLVGAALARPVFPPHRERIVRVIAADVSGSVASVAEVRDSARALFRPGDAIIAFDSAARSIVSPDSITGAAGARTPGSLSAGLVSALRAGSHVRDGADSIELIVISPFASAEGDRATNGIRAAWPGRARLLRVAGSADSSYVDPRSVTFAGSVRPALAVARNRIDTVGAVVASGNVVVAQFERRWRFVQDSLRGSRVIARWVDGEPAAVTRDSASTCVLSVAIPVDSTGDMLLRPGFVRFRNTLEASCRPASSVTDTAVMQTLVNAGRLASATQFPPAADIDSPLTRWLAVLAIVLAIVEMILRRTRDAEHGS
jgi:hypothetical protein